MTTPDPLEEGWSTCADVRAELGHNVLCSWLKRSHTVKSESQIIGHRIYVSTDLIERYLRATSHPSGAIPRAVKRPKGWWGIARVQEVLGCERRAATRWVAQGKLSAVQVKNTYFYDPEPVSRLRLERARPLVGYIQLCGVVLPLGANLDHAKKWLEQNGYPIKFFIAPKSRRPSLYTTLEGAATWLEMWLQKPKTPTPKRLELSAEQVAAFQAARISGVPVMV